MTARSPVSVIAGCEGGYANYIRISIHAQTVNNLLSDSLLKVGLSERKREDFPRIRGLFRLEFLLVAY